MRIGGSPDGSTVLETRDSASLQSSISTSMTAATASHPARHARTFHPPPARRLQFLELRAFGELYASLALMPLLQRAPRGDGHPVLVLPGLIASDTSTRLLRAYLARRG